MFRQILSILLFAALASCQSAQVIKTDILIVGGGTSGIGAGLQSARMGAKTLIIEEGPWLGGMITAAGVSAFDGNHRIPSGIWKEFRERIYARYGGPKQVETGWVSNTLFEPHVGDSIFKSMAAAEKNLTVIHGYRFKKAVIKNGRLCGAIFEELSNGSELHVDAKVVIDATELGDVLAGANIPFDLGMEAGDIADEDVGVTASNDIIQDLTWVAVLKDYGAGADCTIVRPRGYDPKEFDGACKNYYLDTTRKAPSVNDTAMLNYGKLPGKKYMINWPNYGNDHYVNVIKMNSAQRDSALLEAKQQTLRFVYFIQNQLGFKYLGLADDEFPTADRLALMPYHRESRRLKGLVRYNMKYLATPYSYKLPLYRTGIAVGDYPVDHHHKKNSQAPQHLGFYPIPSFNVPLGALIPEKTDGIIVAEKSISVSNVINGATRLQPCVMLIGQAAGALAALAVQQELEPRAVSVRKVQQALLDSKAMLMPYIDATPDSLHFVSLQKIGATGILKGTGIPYQWANQTWFYPRDLVDKKELNRNAEGVLPELIDDKGNLTVGEAFEWIRNSSPRFNEHPLKEINVNDTKAWNERLKSIWETSGLVNFKMDREITRGELAVLLDKTLDPFTAMDIDHFGNRKTK